MKKSVKRKLTLPGRVTLFFSMALFLTGITSGANLLFFLSVILFSLVIIPPVFSQWIIKNIEIRIKTPESVLRKDDFIVIFTVRNKLPFPSPACSAFLHFRSPSDTLRFFIPSLRAREERNLHISHKILSRGFYNHLRLMLETSYPLNFVLLKRSLLSSSELKVYPMVYPVKLAIQDLRIRGTATAMESFSSQFKGFGGLFYGIREYVQGDSLRTIHWPRTARYSKPMVKEYEEAGTACFSILILENRKRFLSADEELFERSIDFLASMAKYLMEKKQPAMLVTTTGETLKYQEGMTAGENFTGIMDFLMHVSEQDHPEEMISYEDSNLFRMKTISYFFFPEKDTLPPLDKIFPFQSSQLFIAPASPVSKTAVISEYPGGQTAGRIGKAHEEE